jgi:glyoxylase-like metal-dependent hydrolase (beta-lactamase superfamily II)
VQGDDAENSYVWIPSLRAMVTGDIVYSGVFVWTAETDPAARRRWAATLDRLQALNPVIVIPGHQTPDQETTPASIAFTMAYLGAFDYALATATTPEQLQAQIREKYPELALDIILNIGSKAAFAQR